MARGRRNRRGYRAYSQLTFGFEAAAKHVAQASELSDRLGGMDKEVKDYFFTLPADKLEAAFEQYALKFGKKKRVYAEATYSKWRVGAVQMSGQVAERLFDILPSIMPIDLKLKIVEGLFAQSSKPRVDFVLVPLLESPSKTVEFVSPHSPSNPLISLS